MTWVLLYSSSSRLRILENWEKTRTILMPEHLWGCASTTLQPRSLAALVILCILDRCVFIWFFLNWMEPSLLIIVYSHAHDYYFILFLSLSSDCIGSAFNIKGAMQCPNCRKIEKGQWLYANGCRPFPEFSMEDWTHDEDLYDLSYSEMVSKDVSCRLSSLHPHNTPSPLQKKKPEKNKIK